MTYEGRIRSMVSQSEGWRELRRQVAAKFRALNDEIRHYPRPIARCDEQLTRLIEQRDRVRALQERMTAAEACEPAAVQLDAILQEALEHQDFAITPALRALIRGSE